MKNHTICLLLFLFLFSLNAYAEDLKCVNGKILIRSQFVNNYVRKDGTKVSGYYKKEYCRISHYKGGTISFQSTKPENWYLDEKFKEWSDKEIEITISVLESLPDIFKQQLIKSFHRGTGSKYLKNPAATLGLDHAIVLYDEFFKSKAKDRILAHEIAHLWYWKLSDVQKRLFAVHAGWLYDPRTKTRVKSKKSIYPDSQDGAGEDFANNAEAYFYDKSYQKAFDNQLQIYFTNILEENK